MHKSPPHIELTQQATHGYFDESAELGEVEMNCYYHPDREAVVSCKKCGRPMCRDCESNALYRPNGAAYCIRCSMDTVGTAIINSRKEMKNRRLLLVGYSFIIFLALLFVIFALLNNSYELIWVPLILFFFIGLVRVSQRRAKRDITVSDIYDAADRAVNPGLNLIFDLIAYTIAGPIMVIVDFFKYFKDKKELENLIHDFKARVNEDLKRESTSSEYFVQEINKQRDAIEKKDADETLKGKKSVGLLIIVMVALIFGPILIVGVRSCIIVNNSYKERQELYNRDQPAVLYLH